MQPFNDITGKKFGHLLALKLLPYKAQGKFVWSCRCDCGSEISVTGSALRTGRRKSCGCSRNEWFVKHGQGGSANHRPTRTYKIWIGMRQRCQNPDNKAYAFYGGRSISVCVEWDKSFQKFVEDMGDVPEGCSLERIDNEKGYSKENCKWATAQQQANNTRRNVLVHTGDGVFTMAEYSRRTGISYGRVKLARKRGDSSLDGVVVTFSSRL